MAINSNRLSHVRLKQQPALNDDSYADSQSQSQSHREDYNYGPASNRLLGTSEKQIFLDQAGNLLHESSERNRAYNYNAQNRISEYVENGQLKARYHYNALGQRIHKAVIQNDGTEQHTLFHYGQQGELLGETHLAGNDESSESGSSQNIVWLQMRPVVALDSSANSTNSKPAGTQISWLHSDHLLTARAATDANQNLIWRWHSDAFGVGEAESFIAHDQNNQSNNKEAFTLNLRFPGQYHDVESGLHYNYHRTYDPSMGRYTQSDPIGLMGGVNTFGYVEGSPLLAMDPLGLFQAPAPGTRLYKELLKAGVISQLDGPAPFIADVAAVAYLVGVLTTMAVDSMLDRGPVLPERADFEYLASEISLYTGITPKNETMTWSSYYDLVDELYSAQRAYVAANQSGCSSDYDPTLLARAENAIEFSAQLNSVVGTSTVDQIVQQQYEDYRANGGDLSLSLQDWVAVGMPQADAVGSKEAGIGTRFADQEKLADHFARHGSDFGAKTALEYQAQADRFLTASKHSGILEKTRANGDIVRYNPATDEFGVLSSGGSIRTYYKPDPAIHGKNSNLEYYNAQ